jgi:hypothetical protein
MSSANIVHGFFVSCVTGKRLDSLAAIDLGAKSLRTAHVL